MNFKNYCDLDECIRKNIHLIPKEVDIVVGIPRSGIMTAAIIALYLNLPLADTKGFLSGKILSSGRRIHNDFKLTDLRKILVVDDSCSSGYEITKNRKLFSDAGLTDRCIFTVVYVSPEAVKIPDIYFETCSMPRIFAWNLMHHPNLNKACVDIDGVLCIDPTPEQNDDGIKYIDFLLNAKPLHIPSVKIGALVTCRLERYRNETMQWLNKHNVKYDQLIMWDLPSKSERLKIGGHGKYKGNIYKNLSWAEIFIESSPLQSIDISNTSLKPVICIENQEIILPNIKHITKGILSKNYKLIKKKYYWHKNTFKKLIMTKLRY